MAHIRNLIELEQDEHAAQGIEAFLENGSQDVIAHELRAYGLVTLGGRCGRFFNWAFGRRDRDNPPGAGDATRVDLQRWTERIRRGRKLARLRAWQSVLVHTDPIS